MDKRLHPDTFLRLYKSVVSNAAVWDGEPIIVGTQVRINAIMHCVNLGDAFDFVATLFMITEDNVRDAVACYKKIKSPVRDKETFRKFTSNVSD